MHAQHFPQALRSWRRLKRLSQLELALDARVSQRHVSFLEAGKAAPSRHMVLQLADALGLPLRERNALLQSAGFAAVYAEQPLSASGLAPVRAALTCMLDHHAPFPALVVDRDWHLVEANTGILRLLAAFGLDAGKLACLAGSDGRLNTLRLTLHPQGLRGHIDNLAEVEAHLVARSRRESGLLQRDCSWQAIADLVPADPLLGDRPGSQSPDEPLLPVLPLVLRLGAHRLSLFTTLTTFGTPLDVTTDELRVESFYPMDAATRDWFTAAQG